MADIGQSGSYPKLAKLPAKQSFLRRIGKGWSRAWYFERLLVILSAIAVPLIVGYLLEISASEIALKLEADRFAASVVTLKTLAKDNNCFGYLATNSPRAGSLSSYDLSYSKKELAGRRVTLPSGFAVSGRIVFDPLGVPDSPSNFTIRHGLRMMRLHVDSQGFVSRQ